MLVIDVVGRHRVILSGARLSVPTSVRRAWRTDHLVYVALTEAGHQETYTPSEFACVVGWKNDASRARFAGIAK